MAEKRFITGAREQKRRLGILALSGAEERRAGDCPEPEELAELMDGACTPSRREELFLHLDSCESCFQEWLELSRVLEARRKWTHEIVSIFSRKRVLAAAGSAFAVAASIVVFMSTPFYQESSPLTFRVKKEHAKGIKAPDSVAQENVERKEIEIDASISAAKIEETEEQNEMSASLPSKRLKSRAAEPAEDKRRVYRLREDADQDDMGKQAAKPSPEAAPSTPLPEGAQEQPQDGSAQALSSLAGADFSSRDMYQDFLVMAQKFCRGDAAEVNLEVLLEQARNLQQQGDAGDGQRQAVIEKVVKLLEEDTPPSEVCERLGTILCFEEAGRDCWKTDNSTGIKTNNREQ